MAFGRHGACSRDAAIASTAACLIGVIVGCAGPESAPPANPVPAPLPRPTVEPAPAVPGPTAAAAPSEAFLRALAGTLPLRRDVGPTALTSYPAGRRWRGSGTAGRALLEAFEDDDGSTSRVTAVVFDPASASYSALSIDTGGRRDANPAVAGTPAGHALLVWSSVGTEGDAILVGQTLGLGAASGPRWVYRSGAGQIAGTALAGGSDGYVAIWTDRRDGPGLLGPSAGPTTSSVVLLSQRIGLTGEAAGSGTIVSSLLGDTSQPALARGTEGYLAAWADARGGVSRIFARVLNSSGQAVSGEILVSDGPAAASPAVAWDGKRYEVTWADGRSGLEGRRDYFVQAISATGAPEGSNVLLSAYRMAGDPERSRVVTAGQQVALFSGRAEEAPEMIPAPGAVFASLLTPGATPSPPFALGPIDGVRLVDAQPWGNGMVVLAETARNGQMTLDWSYFTLGLEGYAGDPGSGLNNLQR